MNSSNSTLLTLLSPLSTSIILVQQFIIVSSSRISFVHVNCSALITTPFIDCWPIYGKFVPSPFGELSNTCTQIIRQWKLKFAQSDLHNHQSIKDTQKYYYIIQGQLPSYITIIQLLVMFTTDHNDAWSFAFWKHLVHSSCVTIEKGQYAQTLDF